MIGGNDLRGCEVLVPKRVVSMISVHCYNQDYLIDHLSQVIQSARYKLMMFYKGTNAFALSDPTKYAGDTGASGSGCLKTEPTQNPLFLTSKITKPSLPLSFLSWGWESFQAGNANDAIPTFHLVRELGPPSFHLLLPAPPPPLQGS